MFKKLIIYGCESRGDAKSPYLTRYRLLQTPIGNIYLHIFHRSDHDIMHDHPWGFVSLILWGGYIEETPDPYGYSLELDETTIRRRKWPGMILFRPALHVHRVELVNGKPAVTLVFVGRKVREWGFWMKEKWTIWWKYYDENGC